VSFDEESRRLTRIKANLERRSLIFQYTRSFFNDSGFLEVETPVRVPSIAPEQYIIPFTSEDWFLSTSPELYMKTLLAAGYSRIFQICRCFRKGELGTRHNPEFTMIEWYRAGSNYQQMMHDTQNLVIELAHKLGMDGVIPFQNTVIDIRPPWDEIYVHDAFIKFAGWDPITSPDAERFDTDLVSKVIPGFNPCRPTILKGYPASMASLARLNPEDPRVAERAEVFIGSLEIANAYSELNDPDEQKIRFENELALIRKSGRKSPMPQRFLEYLAFLPRSGGIALGMDRLVMLLCDNISIKDVLAFPADEL
jgi:elongation factor P--(R)-beta-lysine ligase